MKPYVTGDGWLRVAFDGPELAVIEMEAPGTGWQPAFLDWDEAGRVAQIRWDGPVPAMVMLRVNGRVTGTWP